MSQRVMVAGGGVAGLAAAVTLARRGYRAVLVEPDLIEGGMSADASGWSRRGVPHFLQPHAFIPRGRVELRAHFPDVYDTLIAAGARDVDIRLKGPGPVGVLDEQLQYLAVRRPLIEWALRRLCWPSRASRFGPRTG